MLFLKNSDEIEIESLSFIRFLSRAKETGAKEFILRSPVLSTNLLVSAVERRHPTLLPDTLYLRKSVASRNYGHKDLRLWGYA